VRLEAQGYQPTSFDVQITSGEPISYRTSLVPLQRSEPPPASSAAPIVKRRFYLIPGCYMGDVPPRDARLPSSCDLNRTEIFDP
jgi:hypothetical protein